jgi:hypothetical protein
MGRRETLISEICLFFVKKYGPNIEDLVRNELDKFKTKKVITKEDIESIE